MYNEGVSDYVVDRGLYYPTATNYGYICTGLESAGDWEDHGNTFGLDGQEIQYTGPMNESLPYVYYTPSPGYGYGQYPYNPYNPYIPGAMIGVDGPIVAPQQYYAVPSYENPVSTPAYAPVVLQSGADTVGNGISGPFINNRASVNKVDGPVAKHNLRPNAPNSSITSLGGASARRNSYGTTASEGGRSNPGSGKQPRTSDGLLSQSPSQISQVRVPQGTETGLHAKASYNPLKGAFTSANGLSGFESRNPAMASVHKVKPKVPYGRVLEGESVSHDTLSEQNRGPRPNKLKNQLVVKAFTKKAGNPDAQGNITIFTDEYNKVDFPVDYQNAKFFVIKSYSEDDVHKSIKYNVWSSTPNGNRKLNAAYEDAQRISAGDSRGCPIFLFFSVNASGQFCGVAEMLGPVDFNRDMDFWQQDKWSGSFPVKWHIVKDLPNPNFRHIILENNENKPVTNSRDTQEISYRKGLEMLKIYKNHTLRTSLLDDFVYYENRQRIMQEERARLLIKSYENPYLVPLIDPPRKLQSIHDSYSNHGGVNGTRNNSISLTTVDKNKVSADDELDGSAKKQPLDANTSDSMSVGVSSQVSADGVAKAADELKISSLTIKSDEEESESGGRSSTADVTAKTEPIHFVTIGSMPVNVNGNGTSGILTVGTIPLDPRALQRDL
ncbi:yth domain-containing family protein 2 [Phtheirospermum japonicum]|uniref:YTH domain-containing family protein n=1 Tax=Phtheirospermum japonicum TaxID=374723 RepID=A0A830BAP2_9LAMI|nr:yth domain-containing family protein 2 [Phtheirospermum japonicum]